MLKRSFKAYMHNGKLVYASPKTLVNYKWTIKDKTPVKITFEKWSEGHTDPQRKYYFGVVIMYLLAEFDGYTKDDMHHALKWKFLVDPEDTMPKRPSIQNLTVDEMAEFLDKIITMASTDYGIVIPDANETGE